ncbi:hypothetical protein [Microcoleus sp. FACHB-672]|uniref:hypothetical protein n=1 Tax=Microcoleus sp. FACHB-672 TaxID=2692825 RepID=UPI001687BFF1|nr:hypothetical protein [Microcoleus sp. FACHB-672]MBD2043700.1 hypothetical protein [Microcoleus sp. FACHB-672]
MCTPFTNVSACSRLPQEYMFEKRALMRIFDSFLPAAIAELAQTLSRQGVQPLQV